MHFKFKSSNPYNVRKSLKYSSITRIMHSYTIRAEYSNLCNWTVPLITVGLHFSYMVILIQFLQGGGGGAERFIYERELLTHGECPEYCICHSAQVLTQLALT